MLGDKLKKLRERKDYTLKQVGNKIGLAVSTVGMHEQNRRLPDIPTVKKYAELYGVSIDELLDYNLDELQRKQFEDFKQKLIDNGIIRKDQNFNRKQFESLLDTFKEWQDKK